MPFHPFLLLLFAYLFLRDLLHIHMAMICGLKGVVKNEQVDGTVTSKGCGNPSWLTGFLKKGGVKEKNRWNKLPYRPRSHRSVVPSPGQPPQTGREG